jgi:restriction system protein
MAEIDPRAPVDQHFVGIGWPEMGDLSRIPDDREAFKEHYRAIYPQGKPGAVPVKAGVLYRFTYKIKANDWILYPSKDDRMVNIGVISGPYYYDHASFMSYPNRRKVTWKAHIPRAAFSQSALHEIGSAVSLFEVSTHADEFFAAANATTAGGALQAPSEDLDDDTAEDVSQQVEETTEDFIIKRLKSKLSPYEFESFIAHLLTCMGYHARVTQQSGDGGIDIIAHRDELGFEPPIIKIQCKQTLDSIGGPAVQQLQGALAPGEHGLFVTLGSYSRAAQALEQSKAHIRLIDGPALVSLIFAHYEQFNTRTKLLLPLKRTYIPNP